MRKPKDYQRRLTEPGFGLGPFTFRNRIQSSLCHRFPYKHFAEYLRQHFSHLPKRTLTERIIKLIYERCMEAKGQQDLLDVAKWITRMDAWKRSRAKTDQLVNLLNTYEDFDLERRIRKSQNNRKRLIVQSFATQLLGLLREITEIGDWWEGFAGFARWLDFYRGYVWTLDSRLHRRKLTQLQRAEIIYVAFEYFKVRDTSEEGILKTLQREKKHPRRFVFRGPLEIRRIR